MDSFPLAASQSSRQLFGPAEHFGHARFCWRRGWVCVIQWGLRSKQNRDIMHQQRHGPRAEYRQEEGQRVKDSATLGEVFAKLKRLTVNLEYSDPAGLAKSKQVKYEVNLDN